MADSAKAKDPTTNKLQHQPPNPNLKTWVLKASIHCEGCKKKVQKILRKTPGVHSSDVDLKLQKVTVTGNIDVNALIAKLIKKTGKHAELWPVVKTEQLEKKQSKPKPKRKPLDEKVNAEEVKRNEEEEVNKEMPKTKTSVTAPPEQSADEEALKQKVKSAGAGVSDEKNDEKAKEAPPEKKAEADDASKAAKETAEVKLETVDGKTHAAVDGGGVLGETVGGSVSKKKKNKGQNKKLKSEAREGEDSFSDATATKEHHFQHHALNHSPTRHFPSHMYGPTPSYHAPPVYTVSYNTTPYPGSSYGASYYAMPPPHTEAYAYSGSGSEYQPSEPVSYQSQPLDTLQIFSDENPNACSLM